MWRSDINREVLRSIAPVSGECVVDFGAGMDSATVDAAMRFPIAAAETAGTLSAS